MAIDGLVVDASVVTKWYLRDEALLERADALQDDWREGRWELSAPGHFPYEIAGAILRAVRTGRLTLPASAAAMADFAGLLDAVAPIRPASVLISAAELARRLGVSFFDACYLQVARELGVRLLTADQAFYRQVGAQPDVIWLGDYR